MTKLILAGGSGYIGSVLAEYFRTKYDRIIVLSRRPASPIGNIKTVPWNGKDQGQWVTELEGADALVNLTGKNVNCRYNEKNRSEIMESRVRATRVLGEAIKNLRRAPRVWVQITSATIYRHALDRGQSEGRGEHGAGFSVNVCEKWEEEYWKQSIDVTRQVVLRTSIVLGRRGGAFLRLNRLAKFGLGGAHGDGRQMISWIHEADLCRIVERAIIDVDIWGMFNATSPTPVPNADFMSMVRKAVGMPLGLPMPTALVGPAMWLIQSEKELLLKSRWVLPERLIQAGFTFKYPNLSSALVELV